MKLCITVLLLLQTVTETFKLLSCTQKPPSDSSVDKRFCFDITVEDRFVFSLLLQGVFRQVFTKYRRILERRYGYRSLVRAKLPYHRAVIPKSYVETISVF